MNFTELIEEFRGIEHPNMENQDWMNYLDSDDSWITDKEFITL